jgi:nitrogen fixation NifU-like protein
MSDLTQLYQEIILSHNRNPKNYRILESFTGMGKGNNPLCGDEVELYWKLEDGVISDLAFQARGCAISRASASIMTELLRGKTIAESQFLLSELLEFFADPDPGVEMKGHLGDLKALSGVKAYPSRIKCATLAWHALLENAE